MAITCNGATPHYSSGLALLRHYDTDNDGVISLIEVLTASSDYNSGLITYDENMFVSNAWVAGSIIVFCPTVKPVVQSSYFTKNGSAEWGNCTVLNTDEINCEATVTFSGSDLGKSFGVNWIVLHPNGSNISYNSDHIIATATVTFQTQNPIPWISLGTYKIVDTWVYQV